MKSYLPAKRAMFCAYMLLAIIGAGLSFLIYRYAVMLPAVTLRIIAGVMWALILLIALFLIPRYFFHARVVITKNEIAAAGGFYFFKDDYIPVASIKSVSVIVTPLGRLTGLNFIVINALGSRVVLSFLRKRDAADIAATINKMISGEPELPKGDDDE